MVVVMLSDISVWSLGLCGPDSSNFHLTENYTDGMFHRVYSSHSGEAAGGMQECRINPRDGGWIPQEGKLGSGFGCEALCALLVPSEQSSLLLLHIKDRCTATARTFLKHNKHPEMRPDPNLTHQKLILEVSFKVPLALRKIFAVWIPVKQWKNYWEFLALYFNQSKEPRTWDKRVSFLVNINEHNFLSPCMYANSFYVIITVCSTS